MLVVESLVKDYKKFRAVEDLSFSVSGGEIVGLLGPNGAGKTTALRCVAGILRPSHGRVLINNYDVVADHKSAKRGLAFVPELPSLYELLTVDEHLKFVAMCFDTLDVYHEHGDALLGRYSLLEKKKELVATLSKGMRQKLSVACAMVHRANVLLFDEPIIGIDPQGVAEIKRDLHQAKAAGCAILISTHLLDVAEKLCDRVVIMRRGKKVAEGTLAQLRDQSHMEGATLEDVFLSLTSETSNARPDLP
jgi:ABC-2 type transport system ATP-binding protein